MADNTSIFDALDRAYRKREESEYAKANAPLVEEQSFPTVEEASRYAGAASEAEAGGKQRVSVEIKKAPDGTWAAKRSVRAADPVKPVIDPKAFAKEVALKIAEKNPNLSPEDLAAMRDWADTQGKVNALRAEAPKRTEADRLSDLGFPQKAAASAGIPLVMGMSDALGGVPEAVARNVIVPWAQRGAKAVLGQDLEAGTPDQVRDVIETGRQISPAASMGSETAGTLIGMAANPLMKVGAPLKAVGPVASGAAGFAAVEAGSELSRQVLSGKDVDLGAVGRKGAQGAIMGGATGGVAARLEAIAARMGGRLGQAVKGALENVVLAATPQVTEQGVQAELPDAESLGVSTLIMAAFGGARGKGLSDAFKRELAKQGVPPEAVDRLAPRIEAELDAIINEPRPPVPDPVKAAAEVRGDFDARLAEVEASKPDSPVIDPVAEAKATAAEFDAKVATESPAPTKPVSEAPVAPDAPSSRTLVGKDSRGRDVWDVAGRYYVKDKQGRYGAAHPQEVAEAKASAQTAAIEPRAETPASEIVDRSPINALARAGYPGAAEAKARLDSMSNPEDWTVVRDKWRESSGTEKDRLRDVMNRDDMTETKAEADKIRGVTEVEARPMEAAPVETPAPRPGKQGERGAVDPTGPMDVVRELGTLARRWFGSSLGRIKSYDKPAAEETYQKSRLAIDEQKRIRGEMGDELEAIERVSGRLAGATEAGRAVTALGAPRWVAGKNYATSDFFDLIEPRHSPANRTEQVIQTLGRKVIGKLGKITQDAGLKQQGPDGTYHDFVANTDAIAPRISAPDLIDVIDLGPGGRAWNTVIDAFADAAGVPRAAVEADFAKRHKASRGEGPEGAEKSTQAEFQRQYPQVPVAVKVGGQTLRLFETNPATYFRRLVESRAARLGVTKAFGQDTDTGSPVKDLRDRFIAETNKPDDFVGLMRMLHGQSRTKPMVDPSSALGRVGRGAGRAWSALRESVLTGSPVTNIPESFTGSTLDFLGPFGVARAVARAFKGKNDPLRQQARQEGVITRDRTNLSYDSANAPESVVRIGTEVMSAPRRAVENTQELIVGLGTMEKVANIAAGRGTERDVQRLLALNYDQPTARRLASGQGTPEEYARVRREAPGSIIGANLTKAEKSWIENTRWAKPVTVIGTYAFNTMRTNARQVKAFLSTMGTLADPTLSSGQKFKRAFAATSHLTQFVANKTLQGAAQYLISSALLGKGDIAWSEMKDDPMGFLAKSFASSAIGGVYASTARAAFGDGDVAAVSPQASLAIQGWEAATGKGRYRDMSVLDRMSDFAKRIMPGAKYLKAAAVAIGLGNEQAQDIDNARSAYWGWRRGFDPPTTWGRKQADDEREYRTALKAAYRKVTSGEDPEAMAAAVLEAVGGKDAIGKDRKRAAESIRNRRLLTAPAVKDRLDALKKRIGDKAYKALESHDSLLESLADSVQRGG